MNQGSTLEEQLAFVNYELMHGDAGAQAAALPEAWRELPGVYVGRGRLEELRGSGQDGRRFQRDSDRAGNLH